MKRALGTQSGSLGRRAVRGRGLAAPRRGLSFRLITIVSVVVLAGILASSLLNVYVHQQQLVGSAEANAAHLGNALQASLRHAMRTADRNALQEMVNSIAAETDMRRVRILDDLGRVKISSSASDLGTQLRMGDAPCDTCHNPRQRASGAAGGISPSGAVGAAIVPAAPENGYWTEQMLSGSKISGASLYNVRLIVNESDCHACHDPSQPILGMLFMESSVSELQQQMTQSLGWSALVAVLALALMIGILVPWLARSVLRPVRVLAEGAAGIGRGDLERPVALAQDDELGQLAASFEQMRKQLAAWRAELERRQGELQMLNDVARTASRLLDPQQILDLTLQVIMSSLPVEAGALYLSDPDCGQFIVRGSEEAPDRNKQAFHLLLAARTYTGHVRGEDAAFFEAEGGSPGEQFQLWRDDDDRHYAAVGLDADGERLGALVLCTYPGQTLTAEGIETLQAVGREVGLALANALNFQRLRYTATVEERARMAREMHDSLAQNLGSLKLKASVTDRLLSAGQIDEARANLEEVRQLAGETYTDVREAIFALRRAGATGAEFLPELTRYLEDYEVYYKVNVELVLKGDERPAFGDETGSQIVRIIQEALANARRHGHATHVQVSMGRSGGCWEVAVEDDGEGFEAASFDAEGNRPSFGLQIMHERAASVGGTLAVVSQIGRGTRVCLRVPAPDIL